MHLHWKTIAMYTAMCLVKSITPFLRHNRAHDNLSTIWPLLKVWNEDIHVSSQKLIVIFDEDLDENRIQIPNNAFNDIRSNVSIALISISDNGLFDKIKNYENILVQNFVLILFLDVRSLRVIFSEPYLSSFWHTENLYVLRQTLNTNEEKWQEETTLQFLNRALKRLWKLRRVYKVVVSIDNEYVYYDPFTYVGKNVSQVKSDESYRNFLSSDKRANELSHEERQPDFLSFALTRTKDFVFKERQRFDGYPLRISIFETVTMVKEGDEYTGPEGTFINLVCHKMNVTPIYVESPNSFGWLVNGVFTGALADLAYDRADVSFNQFFVKDYHMDKFVLALYLDSDELCVLTPKAPPVPGHVVILRIFTVQSWFMIILTHVIISLVYTRMRMTIEVNDRCKTHTNASLSNFGSNDTSFGIYDMHQRNIDGKLRTRETRTLEKMYDMENAEILPGKYRSVQENVCLYCFIKSEKSLDPVCFSSLIKYITEVFLQLLLPLENARPRFAERLVLICSLIMSLILTGIFTSQLTSHYSKRTYFKEISSFEELKEIGLPILSNSRDILQDAVGKDDNLELKKYHLPMEYANDTELRRRLIYNKDAAILHRREHIRWKFNDDEIELINVVGECPITYIMAPLLIKGSPFLTRINEIIGQLHNGGFYKKWVENALLNRQLANYQRKPRKHEKLTINHFFIPFTIWFIGLTIGTIVFAFERKLLNVPRFNF